ncbi:hypothetical protein TRICI_005338 [Trichomonascus ciferrii]|uniref:Membrane protein TMS1 n=1 Tax=Trichomonascus ciferrii TaxID=44093 RepID=A0A642UTA2_9ASCO|nr:hypothetical protein TRICI_005338 [Trichomonascus ciferrii]
MGAVLSLPFAVTPAISMVGSWVASCCGAAAFSAVCSVCGKCSSSIATRIGYAVLFLVNSILSWVMLTDWAIRKLEHLTLDYMQIKCHGEECYGFVAVHRINFALGLFHLILALLLVGVHSTKNPRASIQNGYWGFKVFAWLALIVITFFIPDAFFVVWGNYFAMAGSFIFILIGLVLLIDFAHSWAETCLEHIEDTDSNTWRVILVGSTLGMYIGSLVLTIIMYIFFASSGCSMNQAAITINLILGIAISVLSVNPSVQEHNPRAGLAQSAMVVIYCTYLVMSAVAAEPDDKSCNPLVRSRGTRTASIVLGAIFTFVAITYTTTRAAHTTSRMESAYEPVDNEHSLVSQEPSRSVMRQEALRAAVESGSLPSTALNEGNWYDSDDDEDVSRGDDEQRSTKYNYVLFHIIFLLATQWTATLLTMNVEHETVSEGFAPVGRTYFSTWVKIVSAWICYALYAWTLIAPVMFPDRF